MKSLALLAGLLLLVGGCTRTAVTYRPGAAKLQEVARSQSQWTGVAVDRNGSIFVNYPRWSASVPVSVARLDPKAGPVPFPSSSWNDWTPGADPSRKWVCVQSVVVDDQDRLWVLDAANPGFAGVVPGGAKLVCFDLACHRVLQIIPFDAQVAQPGSYLNDVRIDTRRNRAYLTDCGQGALVVVDLKTGMARRVLEQSPSVKPEPIDVTIGGQPWRMNGVKRDVAADGIALTKDGTWLYYHALTGRTLYRIRAAWLADDRISDSQLADLVERVEVTGPCDGMETSYCGSVYLTSIEQNAITLLKPAPQADGREKFVSQTLIADPRLEWPDSMAWDVHGYLYVTTSRIAQQEANPAPYKLYRLEPR